jgi:hypothetical protein
MGAYATVADIQARLAYWTIDVSSQPSTYQVSQWIDECESLIDGALQAVDLPAPYATTHAIRILKSWVASGVEGLVRRAHAAAAGEGQTNEDGKDLIEKFDNVLKDILAKPSIYGAMLAGGSAPAAATRLRAYQTHNADGLSSTDASFNPTFKRSDVF